MTDLIVKGGKNATTTLKDTKDVRDNDFENNIKAL